LYDAELTYFKYSIFKISNGKRSKLLFMSLEAESSFVERLNSN